MGRRKAAISGQLADLDLRLLRVFRAVVDAGGFSQAELSLNLANSTICNHIADLEKRLDMRLCERGRAGFRLTEHGRLVYDASLELLQAVEQFQHRVNDSHGQVLGELQLGMAEHMLSISQLPMVDALRQFSQQAPAVQVQISTLASHEVIPAVTDGRIKLGITVLHQRADHLYQLPLFEEEMQLFCGRGHPLWDIPLCGQHAELLEQYKVVESPRLQPGREQFPEMIRWNRHGSAYHQEARAALILTGHYLGYLPRHMVESWGWQSQLKAVFEEGYSYRNRYYALARPQPERDPVLRCFLDCLKGEVQQETLAL
ncbi:MAG: LysR family transcriptional regulator [Marinobacterium sp.]|nr:LysR family transcriptional regulator [Marinobacterium sp.]